MGKMSDQWRTPDWLFKELNEEFDFSIDLCATRENTKCRDYCRDYLNNELCYFYRSEYYNDFIDFEEQSINNYTCWMNPPYSNPKPFIEKAWEDSKHCKIVCLVKCDPSTRWWATFWDYNINICTECLEDYYESTLAFYSDDYTENYCSICRLHGNCVKYSGPKPGCEIRYFPKRIKFDPPALLDLEIKGNKYKIKCDDFTTIGSSKNSFLDKSACSGKSCLRCKGTGYRWANLAGASFPCALVIMDRRNI